MKKFKDFVFENKEEDSKDEIVYPEGVYMAVGLSKETENAVREYQEKYLSGQEINAELHCTLIYSKSPHQAEIKPESYTALATFGGFSMFGPENDTLVIELNSEALTDRNAKLVKDYGFVSDYVEYKPHMTLSYKFDGDINSLPPMDIAFILEQEYVETLKEDKLEKDSKSEASTFIGQEMAK